MQNSSIRMEKILLMNNPFTIPNFVPKFLDESNKGIDQVVPKLSEVLSYPVLVIDPFYKVLSNSADYENNTTEIFVMPNCQWKTLNASFIIVRLH